MNTSSIAKYYNKTTILRVKYTYIVVYLLLEK